MTSGMKTSTSRRLAAATTRLKGGLKSMWSEFFPGAGDKLAGEQGARLASDEALKRLYATMWIDQELRAKI
jgi:cellulase/cellobiase CelA1